MATFRQIFTGLNLIAKYETDYLDMHTFITSRDQLWAGTPGGPATNLMTDEDKDTMRQNGWFIANQDGGQEEWVWSHFT